MFGSKNKSKSDKKEEEKSKKKSRRSKKNELKKIKSTQSFSPIRDIKDGIVITKDGRFVKIMEVAPINFGLRSASEQNAIINQFAAALRIMPITAQFKIISTRADISHFCKKIDENLEVEEVEGCRQLQLQQKKLIEDISSMQGVSRRFFLIFFYEEKLAFQHRPSFVEIRNELNRQALTIQSALEDCGNEIITDDFDPEYLNKLFYSIMCRRDSKIMPYDVRKKDIVTRYATEQNVDFSEELHIPVNDFFCPMVIDSKTAPRYVIIDDLYYMFCYLPSTSYPTRTYAGWLGILINMEEGIDVDFWYHKEDLASTQRKLRYKLRANKNKLRHSEDTADDYEDLAAAVRAGYDIKSGIASNEDFCYMATMLTITAPSLRELEHKFDRVRTHCLRNDMKLRPCYFQQLEAFTSSLPICKYDPSIFAKSRRNILTSSLASAYPFVSYELMDEDGVLLGTNTSNGSLVFVDNFDTKQYSNANSVILGRSGIGKTYTLLCMAMRFREKQTQVFIIAPLKGIEFERVCKAVGGTFIKIVPGSEHNINIMEIRKKDRNMDSEISAEIGAEESILMNKIQQLHTFFSLILPEITYDEKQILDEALISTYEKFGITIDNDSLIDPDNPDKYRPMPILGDLYEELEKIYMEDANAKRLLGSLKRFVKGSASSFNQPTNVNLDNKFVVLDVSSMTKEILPIGMFIALDYVWDKAREDRTKKKIIFIDETWRLIGPGSSELAAGFVLEIFKVIRGYGGAAVAATQDLNDFFSMNDGLFGTGIINNSKIKIIMGTEAREADTVANAMDLTAVEAEKIKTLKKGHCLLVANTNHVFIRIRASMAEHYLITTDAKDLKMLAEKRKENDE